MSIYFQPFIDNNDLEEEKIFSNLYDFLSFISILTEKKGFVKIEYYEFDKNYRGSTFVIINERPIIDRVIGYCYFKNLGGEKNESKNYNYC